MADVVKKTAEQINRDAILAALDALGGLSVQEDTLTFEGDRFVLPATMEGRVDDAVDFLEGWQRSMETKFQFSRTYPYRPLDGAAAFDATMKRVFGMTGIGQATVSFFGSNPPELRTVQVGPHATRQVPWGLVSFEPLNAVFNTGLSRDRERGILFELTVEAPRKYRRRIEGFFDAVGRELAEHSIYRGKVITGADEPTFLDLSTLDESRVVYSQEVMTQLNANLWSALQYTDQWRTLGIPLKRAVLVEGPYGTGKTLAGLITAKRAEENGWTFVLVRPGVDSLFDALRTAQLYAPAIIWFEDFDTMGAGGSSMDVSRILDALDGASAKGAEVMAGFTTNHVTKLHKGVMRPGRLDAVVHIGDLDQAGIERLIRVTVPEHLLSPEVNYGEVFHAFMGFPPAFAKEAINRAMLYSLARNGGMPDLVATADLVAAGSGLRAQLDLMAAASEQTTPVTIDSLVREAVTNVMERIELPNHGEDFEVQAVDVATEGVDA